MESVAYVGLGGNLGDPLAALQRAVTHLHAADGVDACEVSAVYRSAPVQARGPDFFNAVARLQTRLAPHELLDLLQSIEHDAGRERPFRNAPRTLDLDLLLYDTTVLHDDRLTLPHPRMHQRAFVLLPLADLDPDCRIPGQPALPDLLRTVRDQIIERTPHRLTVTA